MLTAKLDVTKIDKTKLFRGQKGVYLDIVLIETPNSEYGDYMIVQQTSKEERLAGKKGAILGNAKILEKRGTTAAARPKVAQPAARPARDDDDGSVPF